MKKVFGLLTLLIILLGLAGGVMACSESSPPPSSTDENSVRAYADPATETTLQGLSESNLAKYIQYGNAEFKAAVTQETFVAMAAQVNSQLGAYESKEFLRTEEQPGYTIVHYTAKFARGEVGVRMVFDKDQLVAGQWFE
ncbi:MAG: DUF3887 domain-containing protein [Dehalococcoidales bacterium]|nr:DUF3887 domain-containing protein [Dehalococcoidales bacterium]